MKKEYVRDPSTGGIAVYTYNARRGTFVFKGVFDGTDPEIPREVIATMRVCQRLGNPYPSIIIDEPEEA